jgi:phage terminase small subunit
MPVLANPKHERFAQELAKGTSASKAYVIAGYREHRHNASALARKKPILARVAELLDRARKTEVIATERAIERLAISKERVLSELAKIGFSDIRKAVRWKSALVTEEDNPDGGEVLVIKTVVTNLVEIVPSDEIDDATAAAISQVAQNINGGVTVKLHDKRAALVDIGRHLGMFPTKVDMKVEHRRHVTDYTDEDLASVIAAGRRRGTPEAETGEEGSDSLH